MNFLDVEKARALIQVRNGAEIYMFGLANILKEIENENYTYVCISLLPESKVAYLAEPMFYAAATPAGIEWAEEILRNERRVKWPKQK